MFNLSDYSYHLPKKLIAQEPVTPKDASRLMVIQGNNYEHLVFRDITKYFREGDVLVVNNTKVLANKLRGKRSTGSCASVVIEKEYNGLYRCRVEANNPRQGTNLYFPAGLEAQIYQREDDIFWLTFNKSPWPVLEKYGELPLPNYIRRPLSDNSGYQTEFSSEHGSFAAPTSGLHFTNELLRRLENIGVKVSYITLHISFGTFKPIDGSVQKTENEYYFIPEQTAEAVNKRKGRLIVCGTTVFKCLESSIKNDLVLPGEGSSDLFICPGHNFKLKPDMMITNFHLPKSSLILFVSAYFGRDTVINAYKEAVRKEYRFFSLGDACLFIAPC